MAINNDSQRRRPLTADEEMMLQWQKDLTKSSVGTSDRTYYKDLDFKSVKDYYTTLTEYYNSMERLLQVRARNKHEFEELVKMRLALFKLIEKVVDRLCFDWVEATASFSGSSIQRQEAYEAIIDEIKSAVSSCSPPTDKDQLEMFMIVFKHFVKWLMSESLNYSIGERVDATDPQRYGLEDAKVRASAGPDAMNKGQQINREMLDKGKGIPFRVVAPTKPEE